MTIDETKIADDDSRRRRVHQKGVECLVAHSTVGARREMSGRDLAVRPTERTVLAGRVSQNDYEHHVQHSAPVI